MTDRSIERFIRIDDAEMFHGADHHWNGRQGKNLAELLLAPLTFGHIGKRGHCPHQTSGRVEARAYRDKNIDNVTRLRPELVFLVSQETGFQKLLPPNLQHMRRRLRCHKLVDFMTNDLLTGIAKELEPSVAHAYEALVRANGMKRHGRFRIERFKISL